MLWECPNGVERVCDRYLVELTQRRALLRHAGIARWRRRQCQLEACRLMERGIAVSDEGDEWRTQREHESTEVYGHATKSRPTVQMVLVVSMVRIRSMTI